MEHNTGKPPSQEPGPGEDGPGGEKIHVKSDESWKAEAQKEKERLQEKQKAAAEGGYRGDLPPPSFLAFVSDLGLQAMVALGLVEIKGAGGPRRDLPAARYTIDLLGILQEKTRGNLKPEEKRHLDDLLMNLRVAFAKLSEQGSEEGEKKVVEPKKKIIT